MKHLFLTLLLATLCAATGYGQTIKSLGFNATNGQVVANTGTNTLTFTNNTAFATLSSSQTASSSIFNFTLGQTNTGFKGVGAGPSDFGYHRNGSVVWYASSTNLTIVNGVDFGTTAAAAITRTNLGLGLPALTNTSNVTTMRALSGSTNTNHPFSGSVSVVGTNNTNTLVFSNGILQAVE
jgi:hypothetical protein